MNITQILILYIKKTQKNLVFFLQLSQGYVSLFAHLRGPVCRAGPAPGCPPYLIWKGVVGTGSGERRDEILPLYGQDRWLWLQLLLWRKDIQVGDGPVLLASPVPPVGSAPRWQPKSDLFFEVGMMPCCCLSCLGHLAALPGNTQRCHGCHHHKNPALGVHHGGRGSLPKAIFGIPQYMGSVTTIGRSADEQRHCTKDN